MWYYYNHYRTDYHSLVDPAITCTRSCRKQTNTFNCKLQQTLMYLPVYSICKHTSSKEEQMPFIDWCQKGIASHRLSATTVAKGVAVCERVNPYKTMRNQSRCSEIIITIFWYHSGFGSLCETQVQIPQSKFNFLSSFHEFVTIIR